MCYMIVLSTTSERELSEFNTPLMQFSRQLPDVPEQSFLQYQNKWYLGSRDGCSCGFRHLDRGSVELGFSEPVDWWPEDQADLDATRQVVGVLKALLNDNAKLDCVDAWLQDAPKEHTLEGQLAVDLVTTSETSFRFFDGFRFDITNAT